MQRQGPLLVNELELEELNKLKATSTDYNGKSSEFYVYRETPHGFLIPRYALGLPEYMGAGCDQDRYVNQRFPTFRGELWPEQRPGVKNALNFLARENGVFLNARPGSGKTVAGLYIACALKPNKVLVLVDQDNLAEQWRERIMKFVPGAAVSFIMPLKSQRALYKKFGGLKPRDRFDLRGDFIIAMTQTYMHHPTSLKVGMVIVDEAHVFSAPRFSDTIFNVNFHYSLALSATHTRRDGLEWVFRKMLGLTTVVMQGKTKKARALFYGVDTDFLRWGDKTPNDKHTWFKCIWCRWHKKMTCRYECHQYCPTTKKLGTSSPQVLAQSCASLYKIQDYNELAVERMLASDPTYNAWIVETLGTFMLAGRDIFVFSRLREHLTHLHELIQLTHGDVSGLYLGNATNNTARRTNAEALNKRLTLATFGKAGKGLDVQRKDGALFAGPVGKHSVEQVTGRIEREKKGKMQPVCVHPIIPFPTHVARMRGCLGFYRRNKYGVQADENLARKTDSKGD